MSGQLLLVLAALGPLDYLMVLAPSNLGIQEVGVGWQDGVDLHRGCRDVSVGLEVPQPDHVSGLDVSFLHLHHVVGHE